MKDRASKLQVSDFHRTNDLDMTRNDSFFLIDYRKKRNVMNENNKIVNEKKKMNKTKFLNLFNNEMFVSKTIQASIFSIVMPIQPVVVFNWMRKIKLSCFPLFFSIRNMVKRITSKNFIKIQSKSWQNSVEKTCFPSSFSRLKDQLEIIFETRAPWDEEGKYRLDSMAVSSEYYFEVKFHCWSLRIFCQLTRK